MELAIIIPYFNGQQYIHRCINSLENYPKEKVFIVDNSIDLVPANLKATLIKSEKKKIGFGAAVNLGLKNIQDNHFTHILILNQDAFFKSGHFTILLSYLENNLLEKFASPMIYTENFENIMPFLKHRYFQKISLDHIIDIPDFVAVALILPLPLMNRLNGFDTEFFMYYEDNDLIARSKIKNPVRILPHIHVGHHNPDLNGQNTASEKVKWIMESKLRFIKKHKGVFPWLFYWSYYKLKKLFKP